MSNGKRPPRGTNSNRKGKGIPIGDLLPGAEIVKAAKAEAALVQLQQNYRTGLAEAIQNVSLVRTELERLQIVVYKLEGCVMAIDEALPLVKEEGESQCL